ncbi:hypothetical protein D3Z60_02305 [Lachnospiraceae bacterium]|jgi:hypothetical protein|nr:hypothetical protein [Lachnospiraceae bacterium]
MINASKEFNEKLKKGANIVNYADITLSDGTVLHLTYKDFMIGGCSIEDKTTDGKFGVGFVIGKTLTIKIANHDERFSKYDFYNSIIRVYVAMQMDNGTIEKIRKGVYYATVPSTRGEIIEINAVDGMFLLDRDYSSSTTVYPATLQTIIKDACLDCGIPIGFRQFDNMSFIVKEKPEKATYRQIVSWACQIAGYNARIDNDGYMQLIWYNSALLEQYNYVGGDFKTYPHDTILDGGNFTDYSTNMIISGGGFTDMPEHIFRVKTLDIHTDDVQITGVRVIGEDDKTVLFGEEGYLIEVKNPFAGGKEQEVSNYLGQRMVGMVFRPFTAQVLSNPLYEPFEVVRVSDRKGNTYVSIINSVSYIVGSYTQISCQAEDPVRNGSMYYSEAAAAVVEARRNTQKQLSTYDKAVQQMNQIAINTLGYHVTYENQPDGGRITYLHDKLMLEDSTTIYKIGIDGFFVSQDGGQSYTAGFDKNGNAVVNILYAIGIVADWIRSGRFECKKGNKTTFLADVDTGEVRIIADYFSLTSGDTIESIAQDKANAAAGGALDSAKKYADSAAKNAVDKQTQLDIFNKLTNNGQAKGIWLKNGQLYISFTYAQGGTLTLGGSNNERGNLIVLGSDKSQIMSVGKDGIYINDSTLKFTITGNKIDNVIELTAIIENTKYVTHINPTGVSSFLYTLNENNEWVLMKSTSRGASSITLTSSNGNKTEIMPNSVMVNGSAYLNDNRLSVGNSYLSSTGLLSLRNNYTLLSNDGLTFGNTTSNISYYSPNKFHCRGNGSIDGYLYVRGSLTVNGTKSRISKTQNYSNRLLYCYETTKPYFGDIGEATLDENGTCYIFVDDIFYETINTDCQYQVFLQKYGQGDVWVEERKPNYFLIKGTPNLKFAWELKARQLGFETERIEKFVQEEPEEAINYEAEAEMYIKEYYREVLSYEESY